MKFYFQKLSEARSSFLKWIVICLIRYEYLVCTRNYCVFEDTKIKNSQNYERKMISSFYFAHSYVLYTLDARFRCRSQTSYLFMSTYGIIKTTFPVCSYLQAKFCSPHFVSFKYQVNFK